MLKLLRLPTNLHIKKHRIILIHGFLTQRMFHLVLLAKLQHQHFFTLFQKFAMSTLIKIHWIKNME